MNLRAEEICVPAATSGFSAGVGVGMVSPLKGHGFFGNFRPSVGARFEKRLTDFINAGIDADFVFNSSRWPGFSWSATAIDESYVGVYGSLNLATFGPARVLSFGPVLGAGWGHYYNTQRRGHSFFASRAGIYLAWQASRRWALNLMPLVLWNMSDADVEGTSAAYNVRRAEFMLRAGVSYCFGAPFRCHRLYDGAEIDALNAEINTLRQQVSGLEADLTRCSASNTQLKSDLETARAARPQITHEAVVDNRLNTVIDVFFHQGSSTVTADQMPNVERIAVYLKNHPDTYVLIKGYASREGKSDANYQLAARRAQAVASLLTGRFRISPDRVKASGAGIGDFFDEDSWNRVCVCTLTTIPKTQPPGR